MTDWTQEDTRRFLSESELFSEIPEDARAGLAPAARPRAVSADEIVFKRGDEGDSFFVVAKGKVSITLELPQGSQEVSTLQPGDFFGEIAMLTRAHRTATVRGVEDTIVLEFPADQILPLCRQHAKLKERIARTGATRSRESLEKMLEE
jgi:CRP/FNR family cyclic AMP-dependent transcriptional regulator